MYNYNLYIKVTKKEDNKKTKLQYLKNYLQYYNNLNKNNINNKIVKGCK